MENDTLGRFKDKNYSELVRENERLKQSICSLEQIITDGRAENKRLIQECRDIDKYKYALEKIQRVLLGVEGKTEFSNTQIIKVKSIISEVLKND